MRGQLLNSSVGVCLFLDQCYSFALLSSEVHYLLSNVTFGGDTIAKLDNCTLSWICDVTEPRKPNSSLNDTFSHPKQTGEAV